MISGVVIFSNRPFDEGDRVRIMNDMECTIVKQTLMFTHVTTSDGQSHIVPNEKILGYPIVNLSKTKGAQLTLEMDFHSSIPNKKVKSLLVKSAFTLKEVDRKVPPRVSVTTMKGDIISYQLVVGIRKKRSMPDVRSKLLCKVQDELLASDIKDPLRPDQPALPPATRPEVIPPPGGPGKRK